MKKIFVLIFAAAVLVSFESCKKEAKQVEDAATEAVQKVEETATEAAEAVEEAVPEVTPAEALKAFQAYAKEYGDAFNKKDFAKLSKLGKTFNEELKKVQPYVEQFTAKQKKDYDFSLNILKEVNTKLSGK
jgi:predicted lipid-binding transport protein (Tim44 family)